MAVDAPQDDPPRCRCHGDCAAAMWNPLRLPPCASNVRELTYTKRHPATQLNNPKPRQNLIGCRFVYVGTDFGDRIRGLKILVSSVRFCCGR